MKLIEKQIKIKTFNMYKRCVFRLLKGLVLRKLFKMLAYRHSEAILHSDQNKNTYDDTLTLQKLLCSDKGEIRTT